jgi:hypothetical protein
VNALAGDFTGVPDQSWAPEATDSGNRQSLTEIPTLAVQILLSTLAV